MSIGRLSVRQRSRAAATLVARWPSQWLGALLPGEPTRGRLAKFILVNLCTIAALLFGAGAILLAAGGEPRLAALCLLGCFVLDGIDGALARAFRVTSPFGAQMDSLADLCGFGVATPLLAYHWLDGAAPPPAVLSACAVLAVCAMIRLARFNVLPKDGRYFFGLPAAMPAVILAVAIQLGIEPSAVHVGLVAALAVLMITMFPYAKIGAVRALPWWVWPVAVVAVPMWPTAAFGLAVIAYLTSGPVLGGLGDRSEPEAEPSPPRPASASPDGQHVRVAVVGAGFAGLGMAIRLKQRGVDDFVVLERAADVGGTWRDNVYPGAACDVPSNLYSYSFAPHPEWTRTFPSRPEIHGYLRRCAAEYGLDRHLRFGHEMSAAEWQEGPGRWCVTTSMGTMTADVLVVATGPLSEPALPPIPGLDRFAGAAFHSAAWKPSCDIRGKRVAVVGTGASAVQFIPEIQPEVAELYVYQRTPPWVLPRWDRSKSSLEKGLFRRMPLMQRLARAAVYLWRESLVLGLMVNQRMLKPAEWLARRHLRRQVDDPALLEALTPDYRLGCKRLVLSSDYYPAISRANSELVTSGIQEIRRNSIVSADRTEREVDAIIFGTGFASANMPVAERLRGEDGGSLADAWRDGAEAYLGTAVAGFPNLFMLLGPNTISGQNSSLLTMEAQVDYVIDAVRFMDRAGIAAVRVRPEVQSAFTADVQRKLIGTVWASGCRSWYLDSAGRNTTLWPGFTRAFRQRTRRFDHENYLLRADAPEPVRA